MSRNLYSRSSRLILTFDQENINSFPNQKGGLVIFPSYLPHSVTEHTEDTLRVSIAFDITLEKSNVHESIKFMDDEILNRLTNPTNEAII